MKKRILTLLLVGVTVLQTTGCGAALKNLAYNKEDFDYKGYEKVVIENAEFYVPDDMEGTGTKATAVYDDKKYYIEAINLDKTVYADDQKDLAKNIEEYAETKSIDIDIKSGNYQSNSMKKGVRKFIFTSAQINGDDGQVAYIAGDGYEVVLFVADDDYFEDDQESVIVKSLSYTKDDDYTFNGEETSEPATEEATEAPEETTEVAIEETEETEEETEEANNHTSGNVNLESDVFAFQVSVDGDVISLPLEFSDMEDFGWKFLDDETETLDKDNYTILQRWEKGDCTLESQICNYSGKTAALSDCKVVGITFDPFDNKNCKTKIELPGDITLGKSTLDDILEAYGEPSNTYEGDLYTKLTYESDIYENANFYVYNETGTLDEFELENMNDSGEPTVGGSYVGNSTSANTSSNGHSGSSATASTSKPDIVADYVAPKALSADLSKYICELDGDLYQLPCPVSALMDNGWEIDEEDETLVIDSEDYKGITLTKGDLSFTTVVTNYADVAVNPEYAFVTEITEGQYVKLGLVIGKNIKIGDKESTISSAFSKNSEFDVKVEDDCISAYDDDFNGYYFGTKNGKATYVSIECVMK